MKSLAIIYTMVLTVACLQIHAQAEFREVRSVKDMKATVRILNPSLTVIVPDSEPNQRYLATDLPDELKKDGLPLSIDGDIGAIPSNVRLIATPFQITHIKVSSQDKKKYKLSKKDWKISH
jgi:hypothetical protein